MLCQLSLDCILLEYRGSVFVNEAFERLGLTFYLGHPVSHLEELLCFVVSDKILELLRDLLPSVWLFRLPQQDRRGVLVVLCPVGFSVPLVHEWFSPDIFAYHFYHALLQDPPLDILEFLYRLFRCCRLPDLGLGYLGGEVVNVNIQVTPDESDLQPYLFVVRKICVFHSCFQSSDVGEYLIKMTALDVGRGAIFYRSLKAEFVTYFVRLVHLLVEITCDYHS